MVSGLKLIVEKLICIFVSNGNADETLIRKRVTHSTTSFKHCKTVNFPKESTQFQIVTSGFLLKKPQLALFSSISSILSTEGVNSLDYD